MTMVETDEASHERILELRDLQTSYGSILKNTLWTAQNGLYSIGLTNERSIPLLRYDHNMGNFGGCMGHCYDIAGGHVATRIGW